MNKHFSWNSEYYLTELDKKEVENIKNTVENSIIDEKNINVRTIKNKINVNILIYDENFKDEYIPIWIDIKIKNLPYNKTPQKGDIIFFNDINRFYTVVESYTKNDKFFCLNIHPYQIKTQIC